MTSVVIVLVSVVAGTFLLLERSGGFFTAALGVHMYGRALWWIAFDRRLSGIRAAARLSSARAFRLYVVANALAGGLASLGAVTTLKPVFAVVVVWLAACWVSFFCWIYRRTLSEAWTGVSAREQQPQ